MNGLATIFQRSGALFSKPYLVAWLLFVGCAPSVHQISSRPPNLFDKEAGSLNSSSRDPAAPEPVPDIYVRKRDVNIKSLDTGNDTGSLFNPDDERNYLFASSGPVNPGRFLTIEVASNKDAKAANGKGDKKGKKDKGADTATADKKTADTADQDLLKSLPDLEPANKDDMSLLKRFKMRIIHRFENGDVLAETTRESKTGDQINHINVQGRLPYDRLVSGENLSTEDLFDVKFSENQDGELVDRHSAAWEDEYTVRLSGFTEAKSRVAMELDDKRKQLQETKEGIETRIKTLADERNQVAKLRDDLNKKSEETKTKIQGLEDKVKTQETTIADQQAEIEKNKPANKPGDAKDTNNGK